MAETSNAPASAFDVQGYAVLESSPKRLRIRIDTERPSLPRKILRDCAIAVALLAAVLGYVHGCGGSRRFDANVIYIIILFSIKFMLQLGHWWLSHTELVIDKKHLRVRSSFVVAVDQKHRLLHLSNLRCAAEIHADGKEHLAIPDPHCENPTARDGSPRPRGNALMAGSCGRPVLLISGITPEAGEGILRAMLDWSAQQGVRLSNSER